MSPDERPRHEPTVVATAAGSRATGVPAPIEDPHSAAPIDPIGEVIEGRYRIDQRIGKGGMARIYRAHHLGLRRDVAIKILHGRHQDKADSKARFEREAYAASRLQHPNCLQVLDFGTTSGGVHYMVMELLEGHELSRDLGKPMDPDEAVDLMVQVLRGLQHAHENGVVHRDIKPQNVFVTHDHEGRLVLKILDFGLAKFTHGDGSDHDLTEAGMIFGTPRYLSPEQAVGRTDIDARADLYSAGVLFFHMLAGRPPFQANETIALLHQHIAAPIPDPPPGTPENLRSVLRGMLAKHRDDRFDTAKEVLAALRPRPGNDEPPKLKRPRTMAEFSGDALADALARLAIDQKLVRVDGTVSDTGVHQTRKKQSTIPREEIEKLPKIHLARLPRRSDPIVERRGSGSFAAAIPPLVLALGAALWLFFPAQRMSIESAISKQGLPLESALVAAIALTAIVTVVLWWRGRRAY